MTARINKTIQIDGVSYHVELKSNPTFPYPYQFELTISLNGKVIHSNTHLNRHALPFKTAVENIVREQHQRLKREMSTKNRIDEFLEELKQWNGVIEYDVHES